MLNFKLDLIPSPALLIEIGKDDRFRIRDLNEAHTNTTGLTRAAAQGRTVMDLTRDPAATQNAEARYAACIDGGGAATFIGDVDAGGRMRRFETRYRHLHDAESGRDYVLGVSREVAPACTAQAPELRYDLAMLTASLGRLSAALDHLGTQPAPSMTETLALSLELQRTRGAADALQRQIGPDRLGARPQMPSGVVSALHNGLWSSAAPDNGE